MRGDWRGLVADIERTATARGREGLGCFSIEGLRLHERALRAGIRPERVLAAESFFQDDSDRSRALLSALEAAGCQISTAPDEIVYRLTEGRSIGPVLSLVAFPERPLLARLLAAGRQGRRALLLVGHDIEDPGNVGALMRTALASGAAAFISAGLCDAYHPKAVRTSMGSLFRIPILRYPKLDPLMEELRALGALTLGAVSSGGVALPEADFHDRSVALFMGGESFGLAEEAIARLDALVTIPMASEVDSYSVNAAAAVIMYELLSRNLSR